MRTLRWVVMTVLVCAGVLVVTGPSPAFACSCAVQGTRVQVGAADEVFTGTLVDLAEPPAREVMSSTDPITYTVEVDTVFTGEVGPVAVVESAMSGASCGLEGLVVGERYVVFATHDGARRTATSCGGTALATPQLVDAVERVTGASTPPTAGVPASSPEVRSPAPSGPGDGGVLAWAVGAGAVLVGAALLVGRRRRDPS